jgi:hypothetical protein
VSVERRSKLRSVVMSERWFFPAMALLYVAVAIAGFAPNSLAILDGTKENPPLVIHFHAAAMSTWLLLLLTQTMLVYSGRTDLHRIVGQAAFVVAPIIFGLMALIAIDGFDPEYHAFSIGLTQARRLIIFGLFFVWAMLARKHDRETHRRCLFIATVVLLDAAFMRIYWLPWFGSDNVAFAHLYQFVLVLPLLAYDKIQMGHIHRVNKIGAAVLLLTMFVIALAW